MSSVYREITPLNASDCFTMFVRVKKGFDFPLHTNEEFELNLIINGQGAKRIVGDHVEVIEDVELALIGSNLPHGWFNHKCSSTEIREITIQFHRDLFDEKMLKRKQLSPIRTLLDLSSRGIAFSRETALAFKERIEQLSSLNGFDSILELMSILHDLAISRNMRSLSRKAYANQAINRNNKSLELAFEFMKTHYNKDISLGDVAKAAQMTEITFSRFIKRCTGRTFIDCLNEIRLGHASRLLIDTTQGIAEVSFSCGFNNLSYFNRTFKNKKGCTPSQFRQNFSGTKVFV